MTDLRDARFQRALEEAPDAGLRPDRRVRENILEAARAAVSHEKPASHWKKWWNFTGSPSPVWNAAFAGVALATLVTLLWHDREIPDAAVTSPRADKQATAPVAARPAVVAQQAPAALPAPAPTQTATVKDAAPAKKMKVTPSIEAPAKAQAAAPAPAVPPAPPAPAAPAAAPATSPATASDSSEGPAAATAAGALSRSASRAETRAFRVAPAAADDIWTQATIQSGGRSIRIERVQADRLAQLLASVARSSPAARAADASQPMLRIELAAGTAVDIVEVLDGQVRWTRVREGLARQANAYAPDAALLQALQAEAGRLLAR